MKCSTASSSSTDDTPQPCYVSSNATTTVTGHTAPWGEAAPARPLPRRTPTEIYKIQRRDRLNGLIHEYQQVA
jgi:hypothetical protein